MRTHVAEREAMFSNYISDAAYQASPAGLFAKAVSVTVQLVNVHFSSSDYDDGSVVELLEQHDTALHSYVQGLNNDAYSKYAELVFEFAQPGA